MACEVAQSSGAPIADVLDGLAVAVRAELEAAREREAALAGPRTTATVLTWLPLAGVGLGLLTGTNTLSVLFTTRAGWICLGLGAGLWWAGRVWTAALLRRAAAGR
jgi:tight adherence protein B